MQTASQPPWRPSALPQGVAPRILLLCALSRAPISVGRRGGFYADDILRSVRENCAGEVYNRGTEGSMVFGGATALFAPPEGGEAALVALSALPVMTNRGTKTMEEL